MTATPSHRSRSETCLIGCHHIQITAIENNGTIQPKHRRSVWTDAPSQAWCSEDTDNRTCEDYTCPKHEARVYATTSAHHAIYPKHRGPITLGDQPVNAVCTMPMRLFCVDVFCPRHEAENYTTHSARHAAGV